MAVPWAAHSKALCPVNARKKERGDVDIRMEALLVSSRSNDAILA